MTYSYFELNRGRYLCAEHGGFCDEKDGYQSACPICKDRENKGLVTTNEVARAITALNGLQERSSKFLAVLQAVMLGLLSAAWIANVINDQAIILSIICFMLLSIFAYLSSMRHFGSSIFTRSGAQEKVAYGDVLKKVLDFTKSCEAWQKRGLFVFILFVIALGIFALMLPPVVENTVSVKHLNPVKPLCIFVRNCVVIEK